MLSESVKKGSMRIGAFAQLTGVPTDTLRYYEKIALLPAAVRSASGYRMYHQAHADTLRFILSAKRLGMSLEVIKQLLDIKVNKESVHCEDVKNFVAEQMSAMDQRISELMTMQAAMTKLHDACCGGDEDARCCSILSAMESGDV